MSMASRSAREGQMHLAASRAGARKTYTRRHVTGEQGSQGVWTAAMVSNYSALSP